MHFSRSVSYDKVLQDATLLTLEYLVPYLPCTALLLETSSCPNSHSQSLTYLTCSGMDLPSKHMHKEVLEVPTSVYINPNSQPTQSQSPSQPQFHAILSSGSVQNETRKYTAEDWEKQRPEITRLYKNSTLNKVIEFMREQHGFDAT